MDEVVGGCILRDDSVPSGKERGRWPSTSCGANDDHDNKFGRPHLPPFRTINIARPGRCWIVEWSHQCLHGSLLLRCGHPS